MRRYLCAVTFLCLMVLAGCLNTSQTSQSQTPVSPKPTTTTSTREGAVPATEPPMCLDESKVGGGRLVTPIPSPADGTIICQIKYADGLESKMTIEVKTHAPLKEVFPQWTVVYGYGEEDRAARIPTGFVISKATGELVRKYTKEAVEGQGIRYNANDTQKVVPRAYFNIDLGLTFKEPPFRVAPANEGTVRSASPLASPNNLEQYRTFRVLYPGYGFESYMVTEVATGAPMREVFPFWWEVNYLYTNDKDREDHTPTSVVVYRNLGFDTKGAEIDRYQKMAPSPDGQAIIYKDNLGKDQEIAKEYFEVATKPLPE
jgi:hypothetical protein